MFWECMWSVVSKSLIVIKKQWKFIFAYSMLDLTAEDIFPIFSLALSQTLAVTPGICRFQERVASSRDEDQEKLFLWATSQGASKVWNNVQQLLQRDEYLGLVVAPKFHTAYQA